MKPSLYQGQEATICFLENHGFKVIKNGSNYFFALRDERSASAQINKDGSIHDYGSGFHGSVYDVLLEIGKIPSNLSKAEALDYCREKLGSISLVSFENKKEPMIKQDFKKKPIDKQWYIQKFLNPSLLLSKDYLNALKKTILSIDDETMIKALAKDFLIGFEEKEKRLVMPIFDLNGEIVNLWQYNPFLDKSKKLRFCKGRNRVSFNLNALKKAPLSKMVFVCEGEKDVLNAVARGFLAVTSGSAVSCFKQEELELFKDREVLIVGDYDEAGKAFNKNMKATLQPFAKTIKIGSWEKSISKKYLKRGFDLTDYLSFKKRSN